MKPKILVFGVGNNDADYVVEKRETVGYVDGKRKQKLIWICPYYRTWKSMLTRCYSAKTQNRQPTYKVCSVSTEWLSFSVFKNWMVTQDWEGLELDKDLLIKGNKVYSAETCTFVPKMVNTFVNDSRATRGEWPLGVDWHKPTEKFRSQCSNPLTRKRENLGLFACEQEAHNAWRKRKLELAHELAAIQSDPRVAKALVDRYSNPQISEKVK